MYSGFADDHKKIRNDVYTAFIYKLIVTLCLRYVKGIPAFMCNVQFIFMYSRPKKQSSYIIKHNLWESDF